MIRKIIFLYFGLIQGCVGINYFPATTTITSSEFPTYKEYPVCAPPNSGLNLTKDDIIKYKGKPDKQYVKDDKLYFEYNEAIIFSGIYAAILIAPIPLLLPLSKERCIFTIREQSVLKSERHNAKENVGVYCGIIEDGGFSNSRIGCKHYPLPALTF